MAQNLSGHMESQANGSQASALGRVSPKSRGAGEGTLGLNIATSSQSCVILGKFISFSEPPFPRLPNGKIKIGPTDCMQ